LVDHAANATKKGMQRAPLATPNYLKNNRFSIFNQTDIIVVEKRLAFVFF
jgi:hypothetical protein